MTGEETYHKYKDEFSNNHENEGEVTLDSDRARVKDMVLRFEKNTNSDDMDESVVRRKKISNGSLIPPFLHQDRNSTVSINSILSGASEASFDSNSSGFVSDRKSGADYHPPPTPHRPAPPPPEPFNDSSSSTSRSPVPEFPHVLEKRPSLSLSHRSPTVLRRARQPPCVRRKSLVLNQNHQMDTLWSYGVKQKDLEILLRLKISDTGSEENLRRVSLLSGDSSDNNTSENDDDGVKTETVSVDHSTDTLKNENHERSDDEDFGSEGSCERSNYDNVSIKSISSFDNMTPYNQYDSVTVSSDEYGSEAFHTQDHNELMAVSAVNELCVSTLPQTEINTVETKKEKYKR